MVIELKYYSERTDHVLLWEGFGRTFKLWAAKAIEYFEPNGLLDCYLETFEIILLKAMQTVEAWPSTFRGKQTLYQGCSYDSIDEESVVSGQLEQLGMKNQG